MEQSKTANCQLVELVGGSQDGEMFLMKNPPEVFAFRHSRTWFQWLLWGGSRWENYRRRPGTNIYDVER